MWYLFQTCAGAPQIRIRFKLGLRPFHNLVGVLETDLEGIKFNKYVAVSKANPQKDKGRDE